MHLVSVSGHCKQCVKGNSDFFNGSVCRQVKWEKALISTRKLGNYQPDGATR